MTSPDRPGIPATEDLRILVVDDRPENAKLLDRLLRRWRHRNVTCTTRSSDVAPMFRESEFDLLLLDLHMPRMNGHEALSRIKQDPKLRTLPVVVLSTSRAQEDLAGAYERHANSYLVKPDTFPALQELCRSTLEYWACRNEPPPRIAA